MEDRKVVTHGCRKTKKIICGMEGENVVAYDGYLHITTRVINSLISRNCFSKFNKIAQNKETGRKNEIAVNNEILKNHDFLHNLCEIAFAHQCEKMSKFRAIFTRNERKSLRNCQLLHDFSAKNFDWKP